MLTIPFTSVIEGTRARKEYGDIASLATSIRELGLLQPIGLSKQNDGTYMLIFGGRRYRALKSLGTDVLYHSSTLTPGKPGFLFEEEVPETLRRQAELEENLHRLQPKWQEDVLLIADIHEAKKRENGAAGWGQRQTAEYLGKGYGKSSVNYALRAAKLLLAGDEEVKGAESLDEVNTILIGRKSNEALKLLEERRRPGIQVLSTTSFLDSFSLGPSKSRALEVATQIVKGGDVYAGTQPGPALPAPTQFHASLAPVDLSSHFLLQDSILDPEPWPLVDHIVTDIPYGINMDNLVNVEDVAKEHGVKDNIDLMAPFLAKAFSAVRDGGFCVFFYDLDHHEKLLSLADEVGWQPQRWPIIVPKSSPCRNGGAAYNSTKDYECIMRLRKPGAVLRKCETSSVWERVDFRTPDYNHPFAKPFLVWQRIYQSIAVAGHSVLDPYCGEMSACIAAINLGLEPYGIESNENHFNRGLQKVREAYGKLHGPSVQFT